MKRIFSLLLCMLLTLLCACTEHEIEGFDDPIGEANNTISTADPKFGGRYKLYWYDLTTGSDVCYFDPDGSFVTLSDGGLARISARDFAHEPMNVEFLPTEDASPERLMNIGRTADGGLWGFFSETPLTDLLAAESTDIGHDRFTFAVWDKSGKRTLTIPCKNLAECFQWSPISHKEDRIRMNITDVFVAGNGLFFIKGAQMFIYKPDGTYAGQMFYSGSIENLLYDPSGNMAFSKLTPVEGKPQYAYSVFSPVLMSFSGMTRLPAGVTSTPTLAPGYDAYVVNQVGIKGFTMDNTADDLVEWDEYDLSYRNIDAFRVIDADNIIFRTNSEEGTRLGLLTTRGIDGMEAARVTRKRSIITLAYVAADVTVNKTSIEEYIAAFNESSKEYKIKSVYYTSDGTLSANNELIRDILTGNIPDMVLLGSDISAEAFAGLDIFLDLYEFMDKDEAYTRDAFVPCVLEPFEADDGTLPYLTIRYSLATIAGPTHSIGDIDHWTIDDMYKLNRSLGRDEYLTSYAARVKFDPSQKMLEQLLPFMIGEMIDYEKETANFGDTLPSLLKLCREVKLYTESDVEPSMYTDGMLKTRFEKIQNLYGFLKTRYSYFIGSGTAYAGYPTDGASGTAIMPDLCLAITNRCETPDGAWAFIKSCLALMHSEFAYTKPTEQDGVYVDLTYYDANHAGLPCLNASIEEMIQTAKNYYYYMQVTPHPLNAGLTMHQISQAYHFDPDGSYQDKHEEYTKNSGYLFYTMTDEDAAAFRRLLSEVSYVKSFDAELMAIIYDDAVNYFAGTKPLEETVKIIENRVKIKLAE